MQEARPHTTVCSSSLELGIDIGNVRMIGQIGPTLLGQFAGATTRPEWTGRGWRSPPDGAS